MSEQNTCKSKLGRLCCAFVFHGSYCIAAIYIGFTQSCQNEGYLMMMKPNMYLLIGGFMGIVDGLCISNWSYDLKQFNPAQAASHCCCSVWDITWTVIGSYLFTQLTWECQQSSVGLMLFAWIIINWVYIGCRCVFIIAGSYVTKHPSFKKIGSRNAHDFPDYRETQDMNDGQIDYI
eukprot:380441_1